MSSLSYYCSVSPPAGGDYVEWPKCQMAERRMKQNFCGDEWRKVGFGHLTRRTNDAMYRSFGKYGEFTLRPFDTSAIRRSPDRRSH